MWIPKKRWEAMEKRIADLEKEVQSQHEICTSIDAEQIAKAVQAMQLERYKTAKHPPLPI